MRKILVLRGGALGDLIVTLPALAALRRRWPAADIQLVGNATAAALARDRGLLSQVHSQHERRWSALYGSDPLPAALTTWLAEFDLVLNYWPDPQGELCARFPLRAGQQFITAAAMPERMPAAVHYCTPLARLGLPTAGSIFPLADYCGAEARATGPIIIHPGSGSPRKNWSPENWLALIQGITRPVALVLGEAEATLWRGIDLPGVARLEGLPLEELIGHLARSRCFLGHDSGISHLAAACGVPCLLLFGPTDPAMWAPPAPGVRVIRRETDPNSITVAEVRQALAAALAA